MKKSFFSLVVAFLCCSLAGYAQNVIDDGYTFRTISRFFTYNQQPYLFTLKRVHDTSCSSYLITGVNIYDMNLNKVETIQLKDRMLEGGGCHLDFEQYIDKDGIEHDVVNGDWVYLSQTIFNDDADWEYIVPVQGEVTHSWGTSTETVAYTIKKLDGTIVGSISADKWFRDISVINDVVYAYTFEYSDDYDGGCTAYYYTLTEFRKLISGGANAVKAVPAMVKKVSKDAYDLSGRRVSERRSGVVIKDGQKMLVK